MVQPALSFSTLLRKVGYIHKIASQYTITSQDHACKQAVEHGDHPNRTLDVIYIYIYIFVQLYVYQPRLKAPRGGKTRFWATVGCAGAKAGAMPPPHSGKAEGGLQTNEALMAEVIVAVMSFIRSRLQPRWPCHCTFAGAMYTTFTTCFGE